MENPSPPRRRWWKRLPVRTSVRTLMILVLVVAVLLGWIVLPARSQRQAAETIRRAGGRVEYDWGLTSVRSGSLDAVMPNPKGRPRWPDWLVRALGPDYFGNIKAVYPGWKTNDEDMASIGRLGDVEFLLFHDGSELSDAGMAHLVGLPRLKQFVLGPSPKVTGAALASLKGARGLQFLSLARNNIGDAALANLAGLTDLSVLDLSRTGITDAGLAHLEGLVRMESLNLRFNPVTSAGLAHLRGMTRLETLGLRSTGVGDLKPIEDLAGLRNLWLDQAPIDDAGLAPIGHLTSLRNLTLRVTRVTDVGLNSLRGLRSLESIDLNGLPITDVGLANLEALTSLKYLDLCGTQVSDAGLDQLKGLPPQAVLNLFGSHVTAAGIAAFRQSHPQMRVTP